MRAFSGSSQQCSEAVAILTRSIDIEDANSLFPPAVERFEMAMRRSSNGVLDREDVGRTGSEFALRRQTSEDPRERLNVISVSQYFERLTREQTRRQALRPSHEADERISHQSVEATLASRSLRASSMTRRLSPRASRATSVLSTTTDSSPASTNTPGPTA